MYYSKLEIESIHYRIETLKDYYPEYKTELNSIIKHIEDNDANAALLKVRHVLEKSLKELWKSKNNTPTPSIFEILNDPNIRNLFSNNTINKIHGIRKTCNLGVHPERKYDITIEDVYTTTNLLFNYLNRYRIDFLKLTPIPITYEAPHGFIKYIRDSINSTFFIGVLFLNLIFIYTFIDYNSLFMVDHHVYEGAFNSKLFVAMYSVLLIILSCVFSWSIFRRFRQQSFSSRVISFELMFFFVFSFQYLFLSILDKYTRWF
jgi:hypothetical protein